MFVSYLFVLIADRIGWLGKRIRFRLFLSYRKDINFFSFFGRGKLVLRTDLNLILLSVGWSDRLGAPDLFLRVHLLHLSLKKLLAGSISFHVFTVLILSSASNSRFTNICLAFSFNLLQVCEDPTDLIGKIQRTLSISLIDRSSPTFIWLINSCITPYYRGSFLLSINFFSML